MDYLSSSVSGLFRMVFILVLIYFGVRILGRMLAPRPRGRTGSRPGNERPDPRREGEVRIEYTDKKDKRQKSGEDKAGGEYVDYEELD